MRFSLPSHSISPTARGFALLALALAMLGLGGACEDKHIGRLCDPGIATGMGGTSGGAAIGTVASPALECPSRICIVPGGDTGNSLGTGALCTASCESNDDCEGENGPMGNTEDKHCETGFVCMWPTTVGSFACQKLCVCRDFVSPSAPGITKPSVCQ
jgi:hypothetical protein